MSKFTPPLPRFEMPKDINPDEIKEAFSSESVKERVQKYEELKKNTAQEVANKIANEKRKKRVDFLIDLIKALIIAACTLAIEHIVDIIHFVGAIFH